MRLEDFLKAIKEDLGLESLSEADRVVSAVVGALKAFLPEEKERIIADALPEKLSAGFESVEPLPEDIIERVELYMEEGEPVPEKPGYPTITQG